MGLELYLMFISLVGALRVQHRPGHLQKAGRTEWSKEMNESVM